MTPTPRLSRRAARRPTGFGQLRPAKQWAVGAGRLSRCRPVWWLQGTSGAWDAKRRNPACISCFSSPPSFVSRARVPLSHRAAQHQSDRAGSDTEEERSTPDWTARTRQERGGQKCRSVIPIGSKTAGAFIQSAVSRRPPSGAPSMLPSPKLIA